MGKSNEAGEISSMVEQGTEQIRKGIDRYVEFLKNSMGQAPIWNAEQINKYLGYAEKNSAQAFEFAAKLASAKDLSEAMKIQTEYLQAQMKNMTEQTKDIGDAIAKAMGAAIKSPFVASS